MRKNLMKYFIMLSAVALAGGFSSCFEGYSDNSPNEALQLSVTGILVSKDATTVHIGVTARNAGWTLTGDEDWCPASASSGDAGSSEVVIAFLANEGDESRETVLVFVSGDVRKEIPVQQLSTEIPLPDQNPEYPVNKAIHDDILKNWYYWNEEVESTPADYNQGYRSFYESYLKYLTKNKQFDGNVWSFDTERYLYSYVERWPRGTSESGIPRLNYGMEFEITDYNNKMVCRILYVLDKSPAAKAGLKRGDWFWKVNDRMMWTDNYQYQNVLDTLIHPVRGESPVLGMLTFKSYAYQLVDDKKTVTVSSANFQASPILFEQIIDRVDINRNATKTGYLAYLAFDPAYQTELINAFGRFKTAGVTSLILDLRYNKRGTVEMAELMANLIIPESLNGSVFAKYVFNGMHGEQTSTLQAHAGSVGLTTVFVLTSGHTAGASELLINGLKGIDGMTVVMVGDITEGMNVGMVERTYRTDDYEYDVYPVAFRCYNGKDEGNYEFGLSPNGEKVNEWQGDNIKWRDAFDGWQGVPGKTEDQLLLKALNYIVGNTPMPVNPVLYSTSRQRSGYPRDFTVQMSMTIDI